jgi:hypothetical protein
MSTTSAWPDMDIVVLYDETSAEPTIVRATTLIEGKKAVAASKVKPTLAADLGNHDAIIAIARPGLVGALTELSEDRRNG